MKAAVHVAFIAATVLAPAMTLAQSLISVIPAPVSATAMPGRWAVPRTVVVSVSDPSRATLRELGALASAIAREALGATSSVSSERVRARGGIHLQLDSSSPHGAEGYRLTVGAGGVDIIAASEAGLFYGLQTLRQLAAAGSAAPGKVSHLAAVAIDDAPRFAYRGMHLDVGRHFQSIAFVKRYIDLLSLFKLNTFHWHLTEDQGWRIEIKKYPRLTEIGGCRAETMVAKNFDPYVGDGTPHCGFYTQDEIREVVAYAKARHVTIIPEIEMPGHSVAALAAYPELACTDGPFAVRTTWGVDENIFCPSERTFSFIEDVLTEVIALFPSRYIHIGGDEAPKNAWKASVLAQDVMKREGLRDEHELQSYFIRRVERFLATHDRRLIGWDEILEGGLAPQATVMSWRGTAGGIQAAREGHDVIMTPTSHLYFDFYQGDARFEPLAIGGLNTLERVYSYEPVPEVLTAEEGRHILGAQGNVWTEYLKTPAAVEYMAFPRALALAEVTWSSRDSRSWDGFVSRLPVALGLLDARGVNYRLPHVDGLDADRLTLASSERVRLRTALAGGQIRYTLDGSDPTTASTLYTGEFMVPVTAPGVRELSVGLKYEYFEGEVGRAAAIDSMRLVRTGVAESVGARGDERAEQYALRLSALRAGAHPVTVRGGGGGAGLALRYRFDDGAWAPVPAAWLRMR